jgi:hypothetical protein
MSDNTNGHTDARGDITQNDVPIHATDEEATGYPNSDRQQSETAASPAGGDAEAPKHDHQAHKGFAPKK